MSQLPHPRPCPLDLGTLSPSPCEEGEDGTRTPPPWTPESLSLADKGEAPQTPVSIPLAETSPLAENLPLPLTDQEKGGLPSLFDGKSPDQLLAAYLRCLQAEREYDALGVKLPWPVDPLEKTIAWLLECAEKTLRTRPDLLAAFKAAVDAPYSYWAVAK